MAYQLNPFQPVPNINWDTFLCAPAPAPFIDRMLFTFANAVITIPLDLIYQNEVYGYQFERDLGFDSTVVEVGIWADANVDHTAGIWSNTGPNDYNPQLIWQKQVRTTDPSYVLEGYRWYSVSNGPTIIGGTTYTVAATWSDHQIPANMEDVDFSLAPNSKLGISAVMPDPNIFVPLLTDLSNPSYFPGDTSPGDEKAYYSVNLILREFL